MLYALSGRRANGRRGIPVKFHSLPPEARSQLEAKIARLEKRFNGAVQTELYRAKPESRVLCWLTAADGSRRVLYLRELGSASWTGHSEPGVWWHRGY